MTTYDDRFAADGLAPTDPIEAVVEVRAPASRVWAAISSPGNLTDVHPFCRSNEIERWAGAESRDHVHYYSGLHYERDFLSWTEGEGYDIAVGPPSGKIAVARWRIEPTGEDTCRFGIEVTSYVRSDVSDDTRARYVESVIEGAIPPYLDGVVRGVAHFAETQVPVVRNQFGSHPLYSPDVVPAEG